MLCPLCIGGRWDEEAKGQGLGADCWGSWLWGLWPLPAADFHREHFFLWQHGANPPSLGSFSAAPKFPLFSNLTCDPCAKKCRNSKRNKLSGFPLLPKNRNSTGSPSPEAVQSGCHKEALSLHPWAGLGLPLRGSAESSSLWETPHQEPLECHSV